MLLSINTLTFLQFLCNKTSYKGRVLIINNLVASSLWNRLACVDPPTHLLPKIQSILVNFFWDKLHWVPQSVLYLPKEEGGHGLVQWQSRTAAFRVQFLQRLLTGTVDYFIFLMVWGWIGHSFGWTQRQ